MGSDVFENVTVRVCACIVVIWRVRRPVHMLRYEVDSGNATLVAVVTRPAPDRLVAGSKPVEGHFSTTSESRFHNVRIPIRRIFRTRKELFCGHPCQKV